MKTNHNKYTMDIKTNYSQVVIMTDEEETKMYSKFSKAELIKMLIEANKVITNISKSGGAQWSFTKSSTEKTCFHNWFPLPSMTTGISRWQCFKCGEVKESYVSDCFTSTKINEP